MFWKIFGTKSRGDLKSRKTSKQKVAGINCLAKAQNKKSRGFNVAQKVKTKSRGNLVSCFLYARLYNFISFVQILRRFFAVEMKKLGILCKDLSGAAEKT